MNENVQLNNILKNIKKKEKINVGDNVLGEVVVVKDNIALIEIQHAFDKVISPADVGVIFVKNMHTKYVEKTQDCFAKGDIVKARVIEVTPFEYKLATNSPELGVVKSICKKCKESVTKGDFCQNCKTPVTKKFAIE